MRCGLPCRAIYAAACALWFEDFRARFLPEDSSLPSAHTRDTIRA